MFPSFMARRLGVLEALAIDQVIDVGANKGQWARELRSLWNGRILSFEPLAEAHSELERVAGVDPLWNIAPSYALGAVATRAELEVAGNSISSSLLPMLERHVRASPDSAIVARQPVDVRRLDDVADELIGGRRLYLKIDTQGSELAVLQGSAGLFERIEAIELELSLVPLYDSQPLAWQLVSWLEDHGFECFGIRPGFSDPETSRMLQMDGLFTRVG